MTKPTPEQLAIKARDAAIHDIQKADTVLNMCMMHLFVRVRGVSPDLYSLTICSECLDQGITTSLALHEALKNIKAIADADTEKR